MTERHEETNGKNFILKLLDSKTVGNLILLFIAITVGPSATYWFFSNMGEYGKQTEILRNQDVMMSGLLEAARARNEYQLQQMKLEGENKALNDNQITLLREVVRNQQTIMDGQLCAQRTIAENNKQTLDDHRRILAAVEKQPGS